jgi:hypothetical protein
LPSSPPVTAIEAPVSVMIEPLIPEMFWGGVAVLVVVVVVVVDVVVSVMMTLPGPTGGWL